MPVTGAQSRLNATCYWNWQAVTAALPIAPLKMNKLR